jgi:hypothetical protein
MHKTVAAGLKIIGVEFSFSEWMASADVEQCMQWMTSEFPSRHIEWTEQE